MKFFICLLMLASNAAATLDMSGKNFLFPQETNTAHVRLTPPQKRFTAITVCQRFFTHKGHVLFSMATPSVYNEFLIGLEPHKISLHVHYKTAVFGGLENTPNKWHSICTTWDSNTGLGQLWFNGQPQMKQYLYDSPITGQPIVILGQEQDSYGGGFAIADAFMGMLTDVHMWDYVLSPCEIQKFMKEQIFTPGNVLNWAALKFKTHGRVFIENKQTNCTCPTD